MTNARRIPTYARNAIIILAIHFLASTGHAIAQKPETVAERIVQTTGVKGGFVVHLGCGDGQLTTALRINDSYMVQGLAATDEELAEARSNARASGCYGDISIDRLAGDRLPYIDNLVNLVVVDGPDLVDTAEIMRVLVPGGVVCMKKDGKWTKTVKPVPENIDEWTHYLYDSTGNPVAQDTAVGPPARLQWVGSPQWSRHHEHMSSVSGLVSSAGRLFYIFDEGSRACVQLPPSWKLIARDAFNGTVLWKRDIPLW